MEKNKMFIRENKKSEMCLQCKKHIDDKVLKENLNVCPECGYHFRINIDDRIEQIFDEGLVKYFDKDLCSENPLDFPGYTEVLQNLKRELKVNGSVSIGKGKIKDNLVYFALMDYRFMAGSMGVIEGEKIARVIELATEDNAPIVIFTASGGVRIQEGMLAVYQMSKIATLLKKHSNKGLCFISILTDPTLGGVTASFAMLGDIIIAEPNATIGFAGRRVIEQTINEELPENFQSSEFMLEHGYIDCIVDRKNLRSVLGHLLSFNNYNVDKSKFNYIKQKSDHIEPRLIPNRNNLLPWQRVKIARSINRPRLNDYIKGLVTHFIEFHGDRTIKDDKAFRCGVGYLYDLPITIIGTARGRNINENIETNFGIAHPEGYRKALRLMKQAEKFNRPILCLIDSPGAACDIAAEERGQAEAIARCLMEISSLSVPVVTIIHGEGGSGGALAVSVGDYVYMLENAIYSVISPEAGAAIIYKDSKKAEEISNYLKFTANDLLELGIIDFIIDEPQGGMHKDDDETMQKIKDAIYNKFIELTNCDKTKLLENRHMKIRLKGCSIKSKDVFAVM